LTKGFDKILKNSRKIELFRNILSKNFLQTT
jgi:hypothetical protein